MYAAAAGGQQLVLAVPPRSAIERVLFMVYICFCRPAVCVRAHIAVLSVGACVRVSRVVGLVFAFVGAHGASSSSYHVQYNM